MQKLISTVETKPLIASVSKSKSKSKKEAHDFISILFNQIKNSKKSYVKNDIKITSKVLTSVKTLHKDEKKKSVADLLLGEILGMLETLKNSDKKNTSFPKFSDKLNKILNTKSTLKEFKNVKNISDLLKLSKKYNLNLKNIKFSKVTVATLKKQFPKLDAKNFFKMEKVVTKPKIYTKNRLVNNIKKSPLPFLNTTVKPITSSNKATPLQNILKNIDTKISSKKPIISQKEAKKVLHVQKDLATKPVKNENIDTKTSSKKPIISEIKAKKVLHVQKDLANQPVTNENTVADKIISQSTDIKDTIIKKNKISKTTMIQEVKKQNIQNTQNIQNLASDKMKSKKSQNASDTLDAIKNDKKNQIDPKHEFKTMTHTKQFEAPKQTQVKSTLNHFSTDLKSKIEAYKPPISRIKLALNPKHLGEVEVTLVHRGNHLHVNIVSNTNTMSLFTQNQAEFKNSLVNMGFTNLEMNFSDQSKNGQQNQKNKKNSGSFEELQAQENSDSSVELIMPRYI